MNGQPKGNSALGSMVESCVKLTKKLIYGSIRNNILYFRNFEFLMFQVIHLVNRRPIAFKEALREVDLNTSFPDLITPEILIHGYELVSVNVVPELQRAPNTAEKVRNSYKKLQKVRSNLIDLYHSEFIAKLMQQAVAVKDRYSPVKHTALQRNDIVLIKEPFHKPSQYPMGIVKDIVTNDLGEVTGATVLKGKTHEVTKRHVSNLIFLLRPSATPEPETVSITPSDTQTPEETSRFTRKAARISREKTQKMLQES